MASTIKILQSMFGVKEITPSDPGIQKLAALRTGVYDGIGNVTITPTSEALQLLGKIPDPLAAYAQKDPNPFLDSVLPKLLLAGTGAVAGFGLGSGITGTIASKAITSLPSVVPQGGRMGFADGDTTGFSFDNFFGGLNQALQGGLGQSLLGIGGNILATAISPPQGQGSRNATMGDTLPAVGGVGRGVAMIGRSFFNKFPNLATAIQGYRNMGKNVSRSKLYSLMKRFGADFLITGGILTAAAVSELAIAGPGRRRMNSGNVKALRRAHRRMVSFHKICSHNDTLLHSRRRKAPSRYGGGTQITQVK